MRPVGTAVCRKEKMRSTCGRLAGFERPGGPVESLGQHLQLRPDAFLVVLVNGFVDPRNDHGRVPRVLAGGVNGVADDYPIMRHLMNLESVKTYEGTHDIHTVIIGASVTGVDAF